MLPPLEYPREEEEDVPDPAEAGPLLSAADEFKKSKSSPKEGEEKKADEGDDSGSSLRLTRPMFEHCIPSPSLFLIIVKADGLTK